MLLDVIVASNVIATVSIVSCVTWAHYLCTVVEEDAAAVAQAREQQMSESITKSEGKKRRIEADIKERGKRISEREAAVGPQFEHADLLRHVRLLDDVRNAMTSHACHPCPAFCVHNY